MKVFQRKWKSKKTGKVTLRWCADFVDEATGIRERPHLPDCKSELAARKAAAKLYAHREKNPKPSVMADAEAGHTKSLAELLEAHRARPGISDSTRKIEKGQAKQLVEKLGEQTPTSRIALADLDDYVEARRDDARGTYKKKDGTFVYSRAKVTGATIMKELKLLNQALRWAKTRDMNVREPFARLPDIPVERKRPRCLTKDELKALLRACGDDSQYLRQAAEVCYLGGLRRAELFRLTWENVEFPNSLLRFVTMKRGRSKVRKSDVVYLPKRAMDLLRLRYEALGKPEPAELVFGVAQRTWREIETTVDLTFSDAIEAAAKRAGIDRHKEVGAHTLRHSCATHLLESGATVPETAAHLRHRDGGALLLRTYAHVFEAGLRRAACMLADEPTEPTPPGAPDQIEKITAQNGTTKIYDVRKAV